MNIPVLNFFLKLVLYISIFILRGWYLVFPAAFLILINCVFFFKLYHHTKKQTGIAFLIESLLLDILPVVSLIFLPTTWLMYVVLAISLVCSWVFWRSYYMFLFDALSYQEFSVQNASSYISVFLVYLTSLIAGSLGVFFGVAMWYALIGYTILMGIIYFLQFHIYGIPRHQALLFSLLLGIVSAEWFWVILYLPISFYVVAATMTVLLYFFSSIFRFFALGSLNRLIWYRYLSLSLVVLFLILGTAHWN